MSREILYRVNNEGMFQSEFGVGDRVGLLAATAMSNPAYKALLDYLQGSTSSWEMMKTQEILLCGVSFKNTVSDRRVILYLNDCGCGSRYCREKSAYVLSNHLRKLCLKDAADEFLIEYATSQTGYEILGGGGSFVGHIHLNKSHFENLSVDLNEILEKCEEKVYSSFRRKEKNAHLFRQIELSVSACCSFGEGKSKSGEMPCVRFSWPLDPGYDQLEKLAHIFADTICPILLETVVKGDHRVSSANIIWSSAETMTSIRGSGKNQPGELALEVLLEKEAVKQSGDTWRIIMDSCVPYIHLIDTRRSIPYAIKQVQELLGISCAFEQAFQPILKRSTKISYCAEAPGFNFKESNKSSGCSDWASKKGESAINDSGGGWGSSKGGTAAADWASQKTKSPVSERSNDSPSGGWGSSTGADWASKTRGSAVNNDSSSGGWGSSKGGCGPDWASQKRGFRVNDSAGGGWGSSKSGAAAAWTSQKKESPVYERSNDLACSGWGSSKGGSGSDWPSQKIGSHVIDSAGASWGSSKGASGSDWASQKREPPIIEGSNESNDSAGGGWGSPKVGTNKNISQSQWGTPQKSTNENPRVWGSAVSDTKKSKKATGVADGGWGSPKVGNNDKANGPSQWGARKSVGSSGEAEEGRNDSGAGAGWGSPKVGNNDKGGNGQSQWVPQKRNREDNNESPRSWGASAGAGGGDWKNKINRPQRPADDSGAGVAFTFTRQRMDNFTAEEQEILLEVEPIMQNIRRIMHQSGLNDGDPLTPDDKAYIVENVVSYHPDKASKIGAGVDYLMISKHSTVQDTRCFYVVSTDGAKQDFSYRKCLENLVKTKFPDKAETFNQKYFYVKRLPPLPRHPGRKQHENSGGGATPEAGTEEPIQQEPTNAAATGGWGATPEARTDWASQKRESLVSERSNGSPSGGWGSFKGADWSSQKRGSAVNNDSSSGGWGSSKGDCGPDWASQKRGSHVNDSAGGGWGSSKSDGGADWISQKKGCLVNDSADGGWGTSKCGGSAAAAWTSQKKESPVNERSNDLAGSGWGSSKGGSGSNWPSQKLESHVNDSAGGSWGSPEVRTNKNISQSQWGTPQKSTNENPRGWGSEVSDTEKSKETTGVAVGGWGSSKDACGNESSGSGWGSPKVGNNDGAKGQFQRGAHKSVGSSGEADEHRNDSGAGAALGSPKVGNNDEGGNGESQWLPRKRNREDNNESVQSWGASAGAGGGDWKNKGNLPPNPADNSGAGVAFTFTRQRLVKFTAEEHEEQEILVEIERSMQNIRRIKHQLGLNDGDPLTPDGKAYIVENVVSYHPDDVNPKPSSGNWNRTTDGAPSTSSGGWSNKPESNKGLVQPGSSWGANDDESDPSSAWGKSAQEDSGGKKQGGEWNAWRKGTNESPTQAETTQGSWGNTSSKSTEEGSWGRKGNSGKQKNEAVGGWASSNKSSGCSDWVSKKRESAINDSGGGWGSSKGGAAAADWASQKRESPVSERSNDSPSCGWGSFKGAAGDWTSQKRGSVVNNDSSSGGWGSSKGGCGPDYASQKRGSRVNDSAGGGWGSSMSGGGADWNSQKKECLVNDSVDGGWGSSKGGAAAAAAAAAWTSQKKEFPVNERSNDLAGGGRGSSKGGSRSDWPSQKIESHVNDSAGGSWGFSKGGSGSDWASQKTEPPIIEGSNDSAGGGWGSSKVGTNKNISQSQWGTPQKSTNENPRGWGSEVSDLEKSKEATGVADGSWGSSKDGCGKESSGSGWGSPKVGNDEANGQSVMDPYYGIVYQRRRGREG